MYYRSYSSREKHFGAIITAVTTTLKQVIVRLKDLQKQYEDIVFRLKDALTAVLPQFTKLYKEVVHTCVNILDAAANVAIAYLKAALDLINEHQKELKELAIVASELVQDIAKIIFKAANQIRKDVDEFIVLLTDQIKALPIYEIVKEKYNEILKFQIPQSVMDSFDNICNAVKATLPTEELRQFLNAIQQYIVKHAKHEKVGHRIVLLRQIRQFLSRITGKLFKRQNVFVSCRSTTPMKSRRFTVLRSRHFDPSSIIWKQKPIRIICTTCCKLNFLSILVCWQKCRRLLR